MSKPLIQALKSIKSYYKGDGDENKQFTKFIKEIEGLPNENGIKSLNHDQLQQVLDYSTNKQYYNDSQYLESSIQVLSIVTPDLKYELPIDFSQFDAFVKYITINEVAVDHDLCLTLIQRCIEQKMCYNYCSIFTYLVQFVTKKHTKLTVQQKVQVEQCMQMILLTVFKTPQIDQDIKQTFIDYFQSLNQTIDECSDVQLIFISFLTKLLDSESEQITIIRNNLYILRLLDCFKQWSSHIPKQLTGFYAFQAEKKRKANAVDSGENQCVVQLVQYFQPIFQADTYAFVQLIALYELIKNYNKTFKSAGEYTKHLKMQSDTLNSIYNYIYGTIKSLIEKLNPSCYYITSLLIYQLLREQNKLIQLCNIDTLNIQMTVNMLDFYEKYFTKLNVQATQGFELISNQPQQLVQENFIQYDNVDYLQSTQLLQQYIAIQPAMQHTYNFNYMYRGYIELLEQNKLIVEEQEQKMNQIIKTNQLIAINDEIIQQLQIQQLVQYSQLLKNIEQIVLKCINVDIPQFIVIQIIKSIYTLIYIVEKQENNVIMYQLFTNKKQLHKYKKQQLYVSSPTLQQLLALPIEYLQSHQTKLEAAKMEITDKQSTINNVLSTILSSQKQIYTLPKLDALSQLIQYAITQYYLVPASQNVVQEFLNSKKLYEQKMFMIAIFNKIQHESQKDDHLSNKKLVLLLLSLKQCMIINQQNTEETEHIILYDQPIEIKIMHKINQFQQLLIEFGKEFSKSLSRCFLNLISSTEEIKDKSQALQIIADIQISLIVCANVYELSKLQLVDYSSIKIELLSQTETLNQYIQHLSLVIKYFAIKDKFNRDKSSNGQMLETFNQKITDVYGADSCFLFRYLCVREPDYKVETIKNILAQNSLFLNVLDNIILNIGKIITFIQDNNYLNNDNMQGYITCQILYLIGAFDLKNEVFKQNTNQQIKQQIERIIITMVQMIANYTKWYSENIPSVLLYAMQQILIFIAGRDLDHQSTKLNPSFPLIHANNMLDSVFMFQQDQQLLCDFLCELGEQDITFCIHSMFSRVMDTKVLSIKQKIKILKASFTSACCYCGDNELIMYIKETLKFILAKQQHRILVVSIFNAINDERLKKQAHNILSTVNQYNLYMFQFDYNSIELNNELVQFVERYGQLILDNNDQQLAKIYLNVILNYSEYYIVQISTLDLTRSNIYDQIKQIELQIFTQAIKIVLICSNTDQDRYFNKIPEQFGHIYQKFDIFLAILQDIIYSNNYTALELSLPAFGNILLNYFSNHDITKIAAQIATMLSPGRDVKQLQMESLQYCLILITQLLVYYKNEGESTKDEIKCYFMTIQQVFSLGIFSIKEQIEKQEQYAVNCAISFCTFFVSLQQQKEWIFETLSIKIDQILSLSFQILENVLLMEPYINKQVEIHSIMKLTDIFDNKLIQSKRSSVHTNPYGQILNSMMCIWCGFYGDDATSMLMKLFNSYISKRGEMDNKDVSIGLKVLTEHMKIYNIQQKIDITQLDCSRLNKDELQLLNGVFK